MRHDPLAPITDRFQSATKRHRLLGIFKEPIQGLVALAVLGLPLGLVFAPRETLAFIHHILTFIGLK